VLNLIPQKNQQKILDIGCGDGVLLSLIKNAILYGIDLDQASLDYAAVKVNAKFVRASAAKLPFQANFFDVVLATEIIEHLDQPEKLIQEAKRVLKSNGHLILTTPIKQSGQLTDQLHVREFSSKELDGLLKNYFYPVKLYCTHPQWLKKLYTLTFFKFGRFHIDLFRWLINFWVFLTGLNPFNLRLGRSSQLFALAKKYDR